VFAQDESEEEQTDIEALEQEIEDLRAELLEVRTLAEAGQAEFAGYSSAKFELDVLTGGTAIENQNEISIVVPLAGGAEVARERGDGFTTTLSLSRFLISVSDDGANVNAGRVEAQVEFGDYYFVFSNAPAFLLDKAASFTSRPENVRTNAVTAQGGITLGRAARGSALELNIGSFSDDSRLNYKNQWGYNVNWAQRVIPQLFNIEAGLTYGVQWGYVRDPAVPFTSKDVGLSVQPIIFIEGLGQGVRLDLAADMLLPYDAITEQYGDFVFDTSLRTQLFLSEEGVLDDGSRARSRVSLALYSVPQEGIIDFQAALIELPGDAGFLPVVGGDLTVVLQDVISGALGVELGAGLRVDVVDNVTPFARTTYRTSTGQVSLSTGTDIELTDKLLIQTEYTSDYINSSTAGDLGKLSVLARLSF
jgi:hypothetical protein